MGVFADTRFKYGHSFFWKILPASYEFQNNDVYIYLKIILENLQETPNLPPITNIFQNYYADI